jgi:hypothetical protein
VSKGNTYENDLLKLIFNATAIANMADNAASSPLTDLYVALHTADPGEAGSQTTSECAYTSYARVAVARSSSGWTVSTNTVVTVNPIAFPTVTGSTEVATHWSVGTASSGAGKILYSGAVSPHIDIFTGVTPTLTQATSITED